MLTTQKLNHNTDIIKGFQGGSQIRSDFRITVNSGITQIFTVIHKLQLLCIQQELMSSS